MPWNRMMAASKELTFLARDSSPGRLLLVVGVGLSHCRYWLSAALERELAASAIAN